MNKLMLGLPLILLTQVAAAQMQSSSNVLRPWQPEDSSAVRSFASNLAIPWAYPLKEEENYEKLGIEISPDGRHFMVLSRRGDMQRAAVVSTLHVYRTDHESSAPTVAEVSFAGSAERIKVVENGVATDLAVLGIRSPRWEDDGEGIQFLGFSKEGSWQPYRLNVATGAVEQLMKARRPLELVVSRGGTTLVKYSWHVPLAAPISAGARYPIEAFKRRPEDNRLAWGTLFRNSIAEETYITRGVGEREYPIEPVVDAWISPDGDMAMLYLFKGSNQCEFELVKFASDGAPQSLKKGSADCGFRAFWLADRKSVLMAGLPDSNSPKSDTGPTFSKVAVLRIADLSRQDLGSVANGLMWQAKWSEAKSQLIVPSPPGSGAPSSFQLRKGTWVKESAPTASDEHGIAIRQSENDPPRVVIAEHGKDRVLSQPDPALMGVQHLPFKRFRWRERDDSMGEAGLVLPANYRPETPVPLVIHPYFYLRQYFRPEGLSPTGDAAQSLAARGFAVLTYHVKAGQTKFETIPGTNIKRSLPWDAPDVVRELDAVIDALVEQGITSPGTVALSGFSRAGYRSFYALTHPSRTGFAAVAVNDSTTMSYQEYLLNAATSNDPTIPWAAVNRSPWQDPRYWVQHDVLLNADRVSAPILFSETSVADDTPYSPISLQTIGVLMQNQKPFEYLYLNRAGHQINSPLQQALLRNAVVDWMAFWIKGEVDPLPAKAVQYRRWKKTRDEWRAVQAKSITKGEPGFITTRSGMAYRLDTRKSGEVAKSGDELVFHYVARYADGSIVGDTRRNGGPKRIVLGASSLGEGDGVSDYAGLKGLEEGLRQMVGSSRVDLQACKLEYSIVSPK